MRGIKDHVEPDVMLYADLGMTASDNPQSYASESILVASDIIIIEQKDLTLIKLAIPHNSSDSITRSVLVQLIPPILLNDQAIS